jgi:hypothetical protein
MVTQPAFTKFRGTIHVHRTNPGTSNQLHCSLSIAIERVGITLLLKETKIPKVRMILKNCKERGMFLWCKSGKRTTGIDVQQFTRNRRTTTMVKKRLLRALPYQAGNTVGVVKIASVFNTRSIVLSQHSPGSRSPKMAETTMPKSRRQGKRGKNGGKCRVRERKDTRDRREKGTGRNWR